MYLQYIEVRSKSEKIFVIFSTESHSSTVKSVNLKNKKILSQCTSNSFVFSFDEQLLRIKNGVFKHLDN